MDKRKRHARDQMPEDSDPFQDGTVLKEAFDRLNKYVVGVDEIGWKMYLRY